VKGTGRPRGYALTCALIGAVVWLNPVLFWRPSPFHRSWAVFLLLLGALVIVPLGLRLAPDLDPPAVGPWRIAVYLQLPAALLLLVAFARRPGPVSALLSLPWLATTAVIALAGLLHAWQRRSRSLEELCFDAGWIYLVVGGSWTALDRLGVRPLSFDPTIVLLTAIHFHYAGFALPIVTGLSGRARPGAAGRLAAAGVMAGVPLVAAGITSRQLAAGPWLEALSTWILSLAGLLTASLLLRLALRPDASYAVRALWSVAALALAFGMVLSLLYGSRAYFYPAWLDIPWMRAFHGTANALGLGVAGLAGWNLARAKDPAPR
jgi:YndJ-like protein